MNPFKENDQALNATTSFLNKYFNDDRSRRLILGINPGRHGAGLTGIPFTDPKRLISECGIAYSGKMAHEPSSVFIYEMINAYGGPQKFYSDFYINSPCSLGFTSIEKNGSEKNYNYYDSKELMNATRSFMISSTEKLIGLGIKADVAFCLGTGKNFNCLHKLNEEHHFFEQIIPLEHPRFIMQYKNRSKDVYIRKYLDSFCSFSGNIHSY